MNTFENIGRATEYFRGNELSPGAMETPSRVEAPMTPQTNSAIEGRRADSEALSPEREKELEAWMKEVKTFIRGIDVGSL